MSALPVRHVVPTVIDGGCDACVECDGREGHDGKCDCYCYHDHPVHRSQWPHCRCHRDSA